MNRRAAALGALALTAAPTTSAPRISGGVTT